MEAERCFNGARVLTVADNVRRLVKVEGVNRDSSTDRESVENRRVKPSWRPYLDVVTAEPEPCEEQVHGGTTPLIVEWQRVSAEYMNAGDALSRAIAEERMQSSLEIKLIENRKLTLPSSTQSLGRLRQAESYLDAQKGAGEGAVAASQSRGGGCAGS